MLLHAAGKHAMLTMQSSSSDVNPGGIGDARRRPFDPYAGGFEHELLCYALIEPGASDQQVLGLLKQGASPDAVSEDGWTALHFAAVYDRAPLIPALVTASNLDSLGQGVMKATPLMLAVKSGHIQAVDALLAAGADLRCCSDTGHTALAAALARGWFAAAQQLLRHAQLQPDCDAILAKAVAQAGAALDRKGEQGLTRLAQAARQGYHELVPLLVTPSNLNAPTSKGSGQLTPLHLALKHGHAAAAEALLDAGAAVNIPDLQGRVPLAYAVQRNQPQLHVRLLQAMKQQQPAAAGGHAALMEPVITAAARLSRRTDSVPFTTRLFAAIMAAWGSDAAAELLRGLLKRLASNRHYLAEALLLGWRQAQREEWATHSLIDRLQRLVLDPLASRRQQQDPQQQGPLPNQDRALRLRLPLALLLHNMGKAQGQAAGGTPASPSDASLGAGTAGLSTGSKAGSGQRQGAGAAPSNYLEADLASLVAGLSLKPHSSQAAAIAAAAAGGSLREVAARLGVLPNTHQPAVLLVAAQAAGGAGHTQLCDAVLQQFAALDWQAAACRGGVAPFGALVRAAAAAATPTTTCTTAAASSTRSGSGREGVASASSTQQQQEQQQRPGCGPGTGFCLYSALLGSWQGVGQVVARELLQQVVAAVEATAGNTEGAA